MEYSEIVEKRTQAPQEWWKKLTVLNEIVNNNETTERTRVMRELLKILNPCLEKFWLSRSKIFSD